MDIHTLRALGASRSPTSSAAINAKANRNPPLPWFQLRLKLSGYAARAKTMGPAATASPMISVRCTAPAAARLY